jgi:hypothetical protein
MVTLEDLKNSGWQATAKLAPRRSIMSIEGLDKSGKSRLAMSAPEPIVYLDLDVGTEGVIEPMMAQREILLYQVEQPSKLGTQSQVMDRFSAVWQDIQARVSEALQLESGTLVIDTFGEAYEICRLAHFGKLAQVQPHQYANCYKDLREICRVAYKSKMNCILLHKLGSNFHTGELEFQGWKDVPFQVQTTLRTSRENTPTGPVFSAEVMSCRQQMSLMGQTLLSGTEVTGPGQIPQSLDIARFLDILHG